MYNIRKILLDELKQMELASLANDSPSISKGKSKTLAQLATLAAPNDKKHSNAAVKEIKKNSLANTAKSAKGTDNIELTDGTPVANLANTKISFHEGVSLLHDTLTMFYHLQPPELVSSQLFDDRIRLAIWKGEKQELIDALIDLMDYEIERMITMDMIYIIPNVTPCHLLKEKKSYDYGW